MKERERDRNNESYIFNHISYVFFFLTLIFQLKSKSFSLWKADILLIPFGFSFLFSLHEYKSESPMNVTLSYIDLLSHNSFRKEKSH